MRTVPVNQSAGPLLEGCEPFLLMSIFFSGGHHATLYGAGNVEGHQFRRSGDGAGNQALASHEYRNA
jgi:hypothetical protein